MNAANMFCDGNGIPCTKSNEITAFGGLPNDFEIYVYTMTATGLNTNGLTEGTIYNFTVGNGSLPAGTFLAAVAVGGNNNNIQFSTPYTTTGLANGQNTTPDSGVTLMMLGGALVSLETLRRRLRG
jgi:hypothetical protein